MKNGARPDPDRILARIASEEAGAARGRLKVFLGAAAGVGKTYAMLEQARVRRQQGIDVVVGWVETHSRAETAALLDGLETLPPQVHERRGLPLREFDLDGALARRPRLLLLDELAHTNAIGARHAKRWQDAEELLASGIDIFTTVNIQHLESLNDVVKQVTGVTVRETVPDHVLEQADEVELVDLTPEDLLERLREGKVYIPEQAERAARNFFTRGNLIALRELALRRTAERVDSELRTYKDDQEIDRVLPVAERLLVCVSPSPTAARVVRSAARMASGLRAPWIVACVERPGDPRQTEADRERLSETMRLADSLGAETVTLTGWKPAEELLLYARARNVTKIVIGKPASPWWRYRLFGSVAEALIRQSDDIDVFVIRGDSAEKASAGRPRLRRSSPTRSYAMAAAAVTLTTLICHALLPRLAASNLVMIYLLCVAAVAAMLGRGPSILASILSVATFDFFLVPPYMTFAVADGQYFVTFAVMLIVALLTSSLTVRLRQQSEHHRRRQERTATLYRLSREFVLSTSLPEVARVIELQFGEAFGAEVWILLPGAEDTLQPAPGVTSVFPLGPRERAVADWAYRHGQMAGPGTSTLREARALYLPLRTARGALGVIGLFSEAGPEDLTPERAELLEACANQAAVGIERAILAEEAEKTRVSAETERLRNLLLSSVSHDLRTPLATVTGAASTILEGGALLSDDARRELTQSILEESGRLNRLLGNLLSMTRIESGPIHLRREWQPIEETLGAAMNHLERVLRVHPVSVHVSDDLPLVHIDGELFVQVFSNLLDNAVKYSGSDTPIDVRAWSGGTEVVVEIADHGPGLPPGEEERIFEKFYRGPQAGDRSGSGLGLAICRGIIEAHGGRITSGNRPEGGAVFRIFIPVANPPPSVEPDEADA